MSRKFKLVFAVIAITLFFLLPAENSIVLADEEENKIEHNTTRDPMYEANNGIYKNEDVDYSLDFVSASDLEDKGFFDDILSFAKIDDRFAEAFDYSIFFAVQFMFNFNIFMTNAMLGVLGFAYDTDLIGALVDSLENVVVSTTGIENLSFTSDGLFGGFLGIIGIVVAIYTLYQLIIKRARISAFEGLLKTIAVLVVALLFFSNYSTVIKGINNISIEASALLLSGDADSIISENGDESGRTVRERMEDNLFNTFIHKPYLMLQYGTTEQEEIGDDRVYSLLSKDSGTVMRKAIAIEEVTEHGNNIISSSGLRDRLNFMGILNTANAVNSIPVYLLAICLIIFQIWFIVIAMIAPFAMLWASLPNQIGVLKRYLFELAIPLVLKIGVSFLALVVFALSEVMYSLSALANGSMGLILSAIVQGVLLVTMFLLRKRIFGIFSEGSRQLKVIREEMNNSFVNPFKKGTKAVINTAATVGGAVVAGPQGAMVGMNIGNTVGNGIIGETDMGDTARNVGMSMYMADKINKSKNGNTNTESRDLRLKDNSSKAMELAEGDSSYNRLRQYLQSKDLPTDTINETLLSVDKLNLEDIEIGEIRDQYNKLENTSKAGKNNKLFADSFAKGLKINREQRAIKNTGSSNKTIKSTPIENQTLLDNDLLESANEFDSAINVKRYSLEEIPETVIDEGRTEEFRLENSN
ncbi:CD3337/EF1877 family mobilome membrane protein [Ornithinibacillus contaminans]|uniref:CD3337/EF1877 family mobilome membrane protein n=1 Tax=Ornithinibacillus contaminans TaxID=694055 RepID=UPI00064E0958|nr:hypothetical protein [Ornithinibacillus contaminans]